MPEAITVDDVLAEHAAVVTTAVLRMLAADGMLIPRSAVRDRTVRWAVAYTSVLGLPRVTTAVADEDAATSLADSLRKIGRMTDVRVVNQLAGTWATDWSDQPPGTPPGTWNTESSTCPTPLGEHS